MSLLEQEPPGGIESVESLLTLAQAMEGRAAARYRALAAAMRDAGRADLSPLLERLAREEDRHAERLSARGAGAGAPPATVLLPEIHQADEADPARLTPYRVLALAVQGEERAFAFYSHVAAAAEQPAVRALAEALAREELDHAALLRHERRKAFRSEGLAGRAPLDPAASSLAALWARAVLVEGEAAIQHRALAEALTRTGAPEAGALRAIAEEEARSARGCAERIGATPPDAVEPPVVGDPRLPIEAAIAFYRAIAGRASDGAVVAEAEHLAAQAAARLQRLGGR
jgi:rubrerythrin